MTDRINLYIIYLFFLFLISNILSVKRNDINEFNDIFLLEEDISCKDGQVKVTDKDDNKTDCMPDYCNWRENKYYINRNCIEKCIIKLGSNGTDNNTICENCFTNGTFLNDNKCVDECPPNSKKAANEKICFECPTNNPFYLYGGCANENECIGNYSITHRGDYCTYCPDDQFYFNNECIDKCEEPYINKVESSTHICTFCDEGQYYVSGNCQEDCGLNAYYLEEDKACHLCFCNDNGLCKEKTSFKCECNPNYYGDSCEYLRKDPDNQLKIDPLNNKILISDATYFTFNNSNSAYNKIKWEFFLNNEELTSNPKYKKYFITGTNEKIFGINPNLYSERYKKIILRLTVTDSDDKVNQSEIRIYGQKLDIETEHNVTDLNDDNQDKLKNEDIKKIPMKYKIKIDQTKYINSDQYKFYYKFSFLDEYNEEFPLTDFITSRTIRTYFIPFANKFIVRLKNDRGELTESETKIINITDYQNYYSINNNLTNWNNDTEYNNIEKIFNLMILFKYQREPLNNSDLEEIFMFINESCGDFLNENGSYNINNNNNFVINYSEPKVLFALINYIIINQKENLTDETFSLIFYSLKKCTDSLNEDVKLSKEDIISLIRTIEQLHNFYYEENNNKFSIAQSKFYELFDKINKYLSYKLYPGEGVKITGNKTILLTYRFGDYDKFISILSDNIISKVNLSNITSYSYEDYGLNENNEINNEETFLYFNNKTFEYLKNYIANELNNTNNNQLNHTLNVYIVNNIKSNELENANDTEDDNCLVNIKFFETNTNKIISNISLDKDFIYSIKFSYKNIKKKNNISKNKYESDKFYLPYNYSNVSCYPKNYEKDKDHYCYTYFDYTNNIIECQCNVIDEILIIEDEALANFYKSLQFESVNYTIYNKVTKRFIIVFLILLLIPGLIFLLYDIIKANKYINNVQKLTISKKRKEYYKKVKIYSDTKITFPLYAVFNKFPYCQAFNPGYYTSPKYIRHLIVITAILLGFILNLVPFFFFIPFEEKQILIDKRDINIDEANIHSIEIIYKYFNRGFITALISLLCVHIFIKISNKILKIGEKNINYWKNIKDLFKDYAYFKIKKNIYLGKNFSRIKNRMRALYNVCGRFMLNKNIMNHPDRSKKLENYLKYTGKLNKVNLLNNNNKIEINDMSKKMDNNNQNIKNSLLYELPKNNEEEDNNIINTGYNPPKLNVNINIKLGNAIDINSVVLSSYGNGKNFKISDKLKKLKVIKSENFQINKITDNKFGVTNKTINRFEKIKNKYITTNKPSKIKFPIKNINNKDSSLTIDHCNNLSIYNTEDYNKLHDNDISGNSGKDFVVLIIMTCILGFIFILLLAISVAVIRKLMNEFEYFMVKIWMLCSIVVLFIIYFLIYLIKIIIASVLLFNYYHSRNKECFIKLMFKIFVDKSLIYMFKVRNYITKYRREFINM